MARLGPKRPRRATSFGRRETCVVVRVGDQTTDEMMYGFLFFTEDDEHLGLHVDATTGRVER